MKKLCFSISITFLSLLILFLIAEVMFRTFRGPPLDLSSITQQQKSFLFEPNFVKEKKAKKGVFAYTARINKYGYRGLNFSVPKEGGKLRIFAVGDSFTYGVGANEHETIPALIEEYFKKKGLNVEVINAGAGHTSPVTHYINIRDLHLQYEPDVVLLLFDLTDLRDDWHSERHAVFDDRGEISHFDPTFFFGKRSLWTTAQYYSAFIKYIHRKVVRPLGKIKAMGIKEYLRAIREGKSAKSLIINSEIITSPDVQIEYDGLVLLRGRQKKDLIDIHWPRTTKYLKKIRDLLAQRDIPVVLVAYPHGIFVGKTEWNEGRESWGFERDRLYTDLYAFELLKTFAEENNIPFINTLPAFPKNTDQQYFFDFDGHMTPEGNKIVARTIANRLPSTLTSSLFDVKN